MICAWESLIAIIPLWLRPDLHKLDQNSIQEIRLRIHAPPEVVTEHGPVWLPGQIHPRDLKFIINTASRYSPWATSGISQGYLTAPGGHRIGICGDVSVQQGHIHAFQEIHSVNIRIAHDLQGIAGSNPSSWDSLLVIGAPGWGKTTLLRDIAREISQKHTVSVVDERGELFPEGFPRGKRMDVLSGCPKSIGISTVLRTMGPEYIAVDEITEEVDTKALLQAAFCGVKLLATAHGTSIQEIKCRKIYDPLWENRIFRTIIRLRPDKTWHIEGLLS